MGGTCFVVMGFGPKTDFPTGRVLNLDKTYNNIIKPAAQDAGLHCVRADEIVHSGVIDVPMYQHLLDAEVVVADLSTANPNAFYELGVRHALRPYTTIAIAESKLIYPFDVNHTVIQKYEHLGSGIDFDEVVRVRDLLKTAIEQVLGRKAKDSPVYVYLPELNPPVRQVRSAPERPSEQADDASSATEPTVRSLLDDAAVAMGKSDFAKASVLLIAAHTLRPTESFIVQRLTLATYKGAKPTPIDAFQTAREILRGLNPERSTDPETLGLWGAIHKGLWDLAGDRAGLDTAILSYEKGFYLRNDYYNGINLAFLFNVRASISRPAEAIADFISAERVRRYVLRLCTELASNAKTPPNDRYWILATGAEASFGVGDRDGYDDWMRRARETVPDPWMLESTAKQIGKLTDLLADSPLKYLAGSTGT